MDNPPGYPTLTWNCRLSSTTIKREVTQHGWAKEGLDLIKLLELYLS